MAHGGGGVQPVADHVPHDERDAGAGQRDDVEPVPADTAAARLRGQVTVGHVERVLLRQGTGEQAALQGDRHGVLAREAPGVVDGDRRTGGQFLGDRHVVVLERLGLARPPERDDTQDDAAGAQWSRDHRMDAGLDKSPGPLGVLSLPAGEGGHVRLQDRLARAVAEALRGGRDEMDQFSGRVKRCVLPDAPERDTAHRRTAQRRLLAPQDRVGQVDGGEIGEPGDGEVRQLLGGPLDIEAGADLQSGGEQQLQAFLSHIGPAGDGLQLGGVPQRRDTAGRPASGVGRPLVDGQQPVPGQVHLVGGRAPGSQQPGDVRGEAQLTGKQALRVRAQTEQPACLVVGQHQPTVAVEDQNALAHGVQHRVVVLVHAGHLGGLQAVGLAAQPPADQSGTEGGDCQRGRRGTEQQGQLMIDDSAHGFERDPGGHQSDHVALGVGHGDHGAGGRAEGAGHGLPDDPACCRRADGADVVPSDLCRIGVGEADPVRGHHHEEVDAGRLSRFFGAWLEHRGRVGTGQGLLDARRAGEGLGHGEGPVARFPLAVRPGLQYESNHGGYDEEHHDRRL